MFFTEMNNSDHKDHRDSWTELVADEVLLLTKCPNTSPSHRLHQWMEGDGSVVIMQLKRGTLVT